MSERFRVGDVVFDVTTGEIERADGTQRLQPQPALVLATLVRRANALVARDELRAIVWPGVVSDTDDGLNYCIRQIRAALGDGASETRYIETLPRRGYRVVAPVSREVGREVTSEVAGEDTGQLVSDVVGARAATEMPRASASRARRIPVGLVALGIAVVFVVVAALASIRGGQRAAQSQSVAVLPLFTPTDATWPNAINEAITEQLVEHLTNAASPRGQIVGPVTTRAYARDPRPHTELGTVLGVDYVMSGGVRERDSTIFIQTIRSRDGVHVFAWRVPVAGRSIDAVFGDLKRALADRASSW